MEDSLGSAINGAIRIDEMDCLLKMFPRNFGKAVRHFLERRVLDGVASEFAPPLDPAPAKMAIAIKNQQWLLRRIWNARTRHERMLRCTRLIVHSAFVAAPSRPAHTCATETGWLRKRCILRTRNPVSLSSGESLSL